MVQNRSLWNRASAAYRTTRTAVGMAKAAAAAGAYVGYKLGFKRKARRPARRMKPKRAVKGNSLKKQVARIQQQLSTQTGTYTQKTRVYGAVLTSAAGECAYHVQSMNSVVNLSAVIDAVKYFNPSVPGTLISVDMTAPTFQQEVLFTKSYLNCLVRNNYSVPCKVTVYMLRSKTDNSISPTTAMSSSLTDQSNATIASPLIYPTDCHEFNDLWRIEKSQTVTLQPGKEFTYSMASKPFKFDPPLADDVSTTYQPKYHGNACMIRLDGVLGHGATSGIKYLSAGIDYRFEKIYTVKYPAGINVQYTEIVDSQDTIVGSHVVSQLQNEQAPFNAA